MVPPAFAAESHWVSENGGDFSDPTNWSPSPPTSEETAIFDLDRSYTVRFHQQMRNGGLRVVGGEVVFEMDSGAGYQTGHMEIASEPDSQALLRVNSGLIDTLGEMVALGDEGTALLELENGAVLECGDFRAGWMPGGRAEIRVAGAGTRLSTGRFNMRRGNVRLVIADQALVQASDDFYIAQQRGESSVVVDDATLKISGGSALDVGVEQLGDSEGSLTVLNGGVVETRDLRIARQHAAGGQARGSVEVAGPDTMVRVDRHLIIGQRSEDSEGVWARSNSGSLRIVDGATLQSAAGGSAERLTMVGWGETPAGGRGEGLVEVTGENALWQIGHEADAAELEVWFGSEGGWGSLRVADGGRVELGNGFSGGFRFEGESRLELARGTLAGGDLQLAQGVTVTVILSDNLSEPVMVLAGTFDPAGASLSIELEEGFSKFDQPIPIAGYGSYSGDPFQLHTESPGGSAIVEYGADSMTLLIPGQ